MRQNDLVIINKEVSLARLLDYIVIDSSEIRLPCGLVDRLCKIISLIVFPCSKRLRNKRFITIYEWPSSIRSGKSLK